MQNSLQKYTRVAMLLHWLIAILIISLFTIGLYMVELPKDVVPSVRKPYFELHKSLGITVFLLLLIRVYWRLTHQPPDLPNDIEPWKVRFITIVHKLFYISMFLQPLSGYLSSSFSGYPTKIFGLALPKWGWENTELKEFFHEIHQISALILFSFIIVHLLGIVLHAFKGDGGSIMKRMLP